MNVSRLKELISEKGMTIETISKEIGMNPSTFYRKLKTNGNSFSIGEMHALQGLLNITAEEAVEIFLTGNSHKCK